MEGWLAFAAEKSILLLDGMALVVIVVGSVEAFFSCLRLMFVPAATNHERRLVWLTFARWLVAGLTFQLAADIIESAIAPGWEDIGRLAAVAVIRTFLNFFLERDLAEARDLQQETGKAAT